MKNKLFITTTLPYCNSSAHVGHLFEFILGDIYARWFRNEYDVRFNVGLDENGSKIKKKTIELNIDIKEYLDSATIEWKDFCKKFNISYDNFYKTSTQDHYTKVQELWKYYVQNDDIFKKEYTGNYCIGCESFKLDKDLIDGKCPDHLTIDVETVTEENYFFNLGKYKNSILEWLKTNPIQPAYKVNELLGFLEEYTELSVSRKINEFSLGVPVPNDDNQVIYVWCDALANYIFAANEYWEGKTIQLCGSDNNRFQSQIFQCFVAAQNKKHTDKILIHGTILDSNGNKLSKTVGNVIDPIAQLEKFGIDAIRYYCASNFENFSWDENQLKNNFNSHIVNGYGNLCARVLHLIDVNHVDISTYKSNHPFIRNIKNLRDVVIENYNNYDIKSAMENIVKITNISNQYINDNRPWHKEYGYEEVLNNLYIAIQAINELYQPIFPDRCDIISNAIKDKKKDIFFSRLI